MKRNLRAALAVIALAVTLAACQRSYPESGLPDADRAFCIEVIKALQAGDTGGVLKYMNSDDSATLAPRLAQMRVRLPRSSAIVPRLIYAKSTQLTASYRLQIDFAMDEAPRHALIQFDFITMGDRIFLKRFDVSALAAPAEKQGNETFTLTSLTGLPGGHYLFLALGLLSPATIALALFVLYRAENLPRKWPWAIACLFGVCQFSLEWAWDGHVKFEAWTFQLLGIWIDKLGSAPWRVGFGLPLAAYIFLVGQAHAHAAKREIPIQKS